MFLRSLCHLVHERLIESNQSAQEPYQGQEAKTTTHPRLIKPRELKVSLNRQSLTSQPPRSAILNQQTLPPHHHPP